jgi:hypothetical protein
MEHASELFSGLEDFPSRADGVGVDRNSVLHVDGVAARQRDVRRNLQI